MPCLPLQRNNVMIVKPRFRTVLLASALTLGISVPHLAQAQVLKDIKGAIKNTGEGVKQTGEFIKDGAAKTGEAIGDGVKATGKAIDNAASGGGSSGGATQEEPQIAEGDVPTPEEKPVQEDATEETATE